MGANLVASQDKEPLSIKGKRVREPTAKQVGELENAKIERLVFSGGGARGLVYSGAYVALTETRVFQGVTQVAGSSAGSIIAALIAIGMPCECLHQELLDTNFSTLLGKTSKGSLIEKTGLPLYQFIKKHINETVYNALNNISPLDPACLYILSRLSKRPLEQSLLEAEITFKDLSVLCHAYPEHFKELTITAVSAKTGELKYFNATDFPNVEIALACKASGAIPGLLKPVTIEGISYVDGGVADNIPTEAFDKNEKGYTNTKKDKTLVFAFLEGRGKLKRTIFAVILAFFSWDNLFFWRSLFTNSALYNALYGCRADEAAHQDAANQQNATKETTYQAPTLFKPNFVEYVGRNHLIPKVSGVKAPYKMTDKKNEGFQNIYSNYPLRTVGLNIQDVLSTDFSRATDSAVFLSTCGYLDTIDMIFSHDLQSSHLCADDYYLKLVDDFICLYKATLVSVDLAPKKDKFLQSLSEPSKSPLTQYHMIRDECELMPESYPSFALSYAVEYRNKTKQEILNFVEEVVSSSDNAFKR